DTRMAESLTHDLGRDAGGERRRRVAVPQVVQANPRKSGVAHELGERPREPVRMDRRTVFAREHETVIRPERPERELLFLLLLAMRFERADRRGIESDRSATLRGLWFGKLDSAVVDDREVSHHRHAGVAEI